MLYYSPSETPASSKRFLSFIEIFSFFKEEITLSLSGWFQQRLWPREARQPPIPFHLSPGTRLSFRQAPPQVLSPPCCFTSKFGMDWCGSTMARAPEKTHRRETSISLATHLFLRLALRSSSLSPKAAPSVMGKDEPIC